MHAFTDDWNALSCNDCNEKNLYYKKCMERKGKLEKMTISAKYEFNHNFQFYFCQEVLFSQM